MFWGRLLLAASQKPHSAFFKAWWWSCQRPQKPVWQCWGYIYAHDFAILGKVQGQGGCCAVPNMMDAAPNTLLAGGTPVLGPVPLSSEGPSSWKVRGVPTPHEDVWGLACCKNIRLLCGSQFILCERPRPGRVLPTPALCKHAGWQTVCDKGLLAQKCWDRWWRQTCG